MPPKLTGWALLLPVIALNVANGVAFCDLLGISAVSSAVSDAFAESGSIGWSPTSQLIGATVGQCILGYLSDAWSRRTMLLFALFLLFASSLGTSLIFSSKLPILFVVLRAISGVAVGSISSLVNIAQSDISTDEQRLNLQGVQGFSVGAGSILGMMVGAVFARQHKMHQLYYMETGLAVLAFILIFCLFNHRNPKPSNRNFREVARAIDYVGILTGMGTIVPFLVLITHSADFTATVQGVLVGLTAICGALYVINYLNNPFNCLPIINFRLFRNRSLAAIYLQNFLMGMAYYAFIFFLPGYLTVVRQYTALEASEMMIAYFVIHAGWSTGSALFVRHLQKQGYKSFSTVLLQGFATWFGAVVMLAVGTSVDNEIPIWVVILVASAVGFGTGGVFQNSVLAIKEQVDKEFATALGIRNVLRYLGGATGTAVSSAIMKSTLTKMVPAGVDDKFRVHTMKPEQLSTLEIDDQASIRRAFGRGITWVFMTSAVLLLICIVGCIWIRDKPRPKESKEKASKMSSRSPSLESNINGSTPTATRDNTAVV